MADLNVSSLNRSGSRLGPESPPPSIVNVEAKDLLRALRERLHKTQEEIADAAEMARTDYVRLETGHNKFSSHRMRERVAKAMRLDPYRLNRYIDGSLTLDELVPAQAEADQRYANRPRAIEMLIELHASEKAIAAVRKHQLLTAEQPPVRFWVNLGLQADETTPVPISQERKTRAAREALSTVQLPTKQPPARVAEPTADVEHEGKKDRSISSSGDRKRR